MTERPAVPSARLPEVDPEALDAEAAGVLEEIIAGRGRLPSPFKVWLASPQLARRMAPLGEFLATGSSLTSAEKELAILIAARQIGARYVAKVHAREAIDAGVSESVVAAIAEGRPPSVSDARQSALVDMLYALLGPEVPSDAVFDAAVADLGHAGVAEVMALAGYFTAVGLAMKMYAVPPAGESQS